MTMNSKLVVGLVVLSLGLSSCSDTRLVTSWHQPGVTIDKRNLDRLLVIALIKDDATRRQTEDRLVAFSAPHGVASYQYLGNDVEAINDPGVNDRLIRDGIDGILIMRLMDREKEQVWVPGMMMQPMMMSPWGFHGMGGPMWNNPGFMTVDVTYVIQTNVYKTEPSQLLWSGTTTTVNPNRLVNSINEVTRVVYKQMVKDGFVRKDQKWKSKGRRG
jgi:aryl carrier-like protein